MPALLTPAVLTVAQRQYPRPYDSRSACRHGHLATTGIPRIFRVYLAGMGLLAAGYADFPLIACHLQQVNVVPPAWIPILYAVAMVTEAVADELRVACLGADLPAPIWERVITDAEKERYVWQLGIERVGVLGNGANDKAVGASCGSSPRPYPEWGI